MTKSGDFFVPNGWYEPWEISVSTFEDLRKAISVLVKRNTGNRIVWRGLMHDQYANLSTLARVVAKGSVVPTVDTELQTVEREIVSEAERTWRMKVDSPEELFAAMQHLGAPTRFIDITADPYTAAWFATQKTSNPKQPSRILGFVFAESDILTTSELIRARDFMHVPPQKNEPIWMGTRSSNIAEDWGSYRQKAMVWFPHADTHPRIEAQQGGFMFDRLPSFGNGANIARRGPSENGVQKGTWSKEEVIKASAFNVRLVKANGKVTEGNTTPMFSIKIAGRARHLIHKALNEEMRITEAKLFPSVDGLANSFRKRFSEPPM